ncbi:MAG: PilN domain-containing protein [Elusimicrobiota bacterium]|nr:PilN domain-containing protein [Elusimicrobiota bacterium]
MIKVNLVPADILAKAAQRQLLLQISVIGALLLLLLTGLSAGHFYGKYRLEQDLAYNEAELKRLSAIVAQVEELEKAAAAVRARLNVIEDLLRGRAFYPIFMSEFARTVPPGVRVTNMRTTSQPASALKLDIAATANTNEDIAAWVRTLETNPRFASVELGPVSSSGVRGYSFSITTVYTQKL